MVHQEVSTRKRLQEQGVMSFEGWLGSSPDLTSIENLWSQVNLAQGCKHATSNAGLKKIARWVWRQVTPQYIQTLYKSMPRRLTAAVQAQGSHTKY